MSDSVEEPRKLSFDNVDSVYPDMELKRIGESSKSSSVRSPRDLSADNIKLGVGDDLVEDAEGEEEDCNKDGEDMLKSKSKLKHVNIFTDSDEFNQLKTNVTENVLRHATTMTSSCTIKSEEPTIAEEDTRAADEDDDEIDGGKRNPLRDAALKLNVSVQLVENSLLLDKGEFECSNSPRMMGMSGGSWKKIGNPMSNSSSSSTTTSMFASQFNQADEVEALKEEPAEKEEEDEDDKEENRGDRYASMHASVAAAKSNEVNINQVDGILHHKSSVKYVNLSSENEVQAIAEEADARNEEDEATSQNSVLISAKLEREQQKDFIKKIVSGDKDKKAELDTLLMSQNQSQPNDALHGHAIHEEDDDVEEQEEDAAADEKTSKSEGTSEQ